MRCRISPHWLQFSDKSIELRTFVCDGSLQVLSLHNLVDHIVRDLLNEWLVLVEDRLLLEEFIPVGTTPFMRVSTEPFRQLDMQ